MEPLLVFPDPAPPELAQVLDLGGWAWKAASDLDAARNEQPTKGWTGAVIVAGTTPDDAFRLCRSIRSGDIHCGPVLILIGGGHLASLDFREDLFNNFCLYPFHPIELEARLKHQFRQIGKAERAEVIEYGPLGMNFETYQAMIDGQPLDLTYMEYELLKFLASHPGKVFTRETLLNRVWGYDYYGGARTVDVHIRRLRAKLGEEHANLIQTVRSVGYRFGISRWT